MKNNDQVKYAYIIYNNKSFVKFIDIYDKDIALKLLQVDKKFIRFISSNIINDKEIILASKDDFVSSLCSGQNVHLLEDKEFVIQCYEKSIEKYNFVKNIPLKAISKELIDHVEKSDEHVSLFLKRRISDKNFLLEIKPKVYPKMNKDYNMCNFKENGNLIFVNNNQYTQNIPNCTPLYCKEQEKEISVPENLKDVFEALKQKLRLENSDVLKDILNKLEKVMN